MNLHKGGKCTCHVEKFSAQQKISLAGKHSQRTNQSLFTKQKKQKKRFCDSDLTLRTTDEPKLTRAFVALIENASEQFITLVASCGFIKGMHNKLVAVFCGAGRLRVVPEKSTSLRVVFQDVDL